MPVRLIAIDLDGTLLGPEGVGDGDRDAILEARRRGIEIVIATVTVAEIAAGSAHTIVRALPAHRSGAPEHFTFGCGAQGQLGHGNLDEQLVPKRLELGVSNLSSPQSPMW